MHFWAWLYLTKVPGWSCEAGFWVNSLANFHDTVLPYCMIYILLDMYAVQLYCKLKFIINT